MEEEGGGGGGGGGGGEEEEEEEEGGVGRGKTQEKMGRGNRKRSSRTKNFVYYTYSRTQLYCPQQYSRNTTTCFGPICGPASGGDSTYRAAIQDVWGVCLEIGLGGGNEISFQ
jgi:hypothetical protein